MSGVKLWTKLAILVSLSPLGVSFAQVGYGDASGTGTGLYSGHGDIVRDRDLWSYRRYNISPNPEVHFDPIFGIESENLEEDIDRDKVSRDSRTSNMSSNSDSIFGIENKNLESSDPAIEAETENDSDLSEIAYPIAQLLRHQGLQQSADQIENSADLGDTQGSVMAGHLYFYGLGRERNSRKALEWYEKVASERSDAAEKAADIYALGMGVPKNPRSAIRYYNLAIAQGSPNAAVKLADFYRKTQVESDEYERAFELYRQSAEEGNLLGKIRMADMYLTREKKDIDETRAFKRAYELYLETADAGSPEGMNKAGELLMEGKGVESNPESAVELWRRAAEEKYPPAIRNIGLAYRDGRGVESNPLHAISFLRVAQDLGFSDAGEEADQLVWDHCEGKNDGLCSSVPILYVTTRREVRGADGSISFNIDPSKNNKMYYGISSWIVPNDRSDEYKRRSRYAAIDAQNLFKRAPYRTRFRAQGISPLTKDEFFQILRNNKGEMDIVLFVHGYNSTFDNATRHAAQFAYDTKFPGIPIIYSWRSHGEFESYVADLGNQMIDCTPFVDLLSDITSIMGSGRNVRIVAHSMGSELIFSALTSCVNSGRTYSGQALAEIVLAAPDISTGSFTEYADKFSDKADRVTLYVSSNDKALSYAAKILWAGNERLGSVRWLQVIQPEIQTVDTSNLRNSDIIGHAYIFQHPRVIRDAEEILHEGLEPDCRTWPIRRYQNDLPYWELDNREEPPARSDTKCKATL